MDDDPKVLVTGAGGQVGRALRGLGFPAHYTTREDLDVSDVEVVRRAVAGTKCVVHLAALTDVDGCEQEPDLARRINAEGAANVAKAAAAERAMVIYVSTDYVFDGLKDGAYDEIDPPNPLNVYGTTKLAGEGHVLEHEGNLVVRTSWVMGDGVNFFSKIVGAARTRDLLEVVADQHGRPTFATRLAEAIVACIERGMTGILHVTGDGPATTWADLAELALDTLGLATKIARVDSDTYASKSSGLVATRPVNSVLSLQRARDEGIPLHDWRNDLGDFLRGLA